MGRMNFSEVNSNVTFKVLSYYFQNLSKNSKEYIKFYIKAQFLSKYENSKLYHQ